MNRSHRSRAVLIALFLLIGMGITLTQPATIAGPVTSDAGGRNRTATWDFETPTDYSWSNVKVADGVVLNHTTGAWLLTPSDFSANGTLEPQVVVANGSLHLKGNEQSLVANGEFDSSADWTFEDSPGGTVRASSGLGRAHFLHATLDNNSQFDSMDNILVNWTFVSSPGAIGGVTQDTVRQEGTGSARIRITLPSASDWAGIQRTTLNPWNFLPYNRFAVRFSHTYTGEGQLLAILNLLSSTTEWNSAPVPIARTWNTAVFDISGFGNALSSVSRIQIRITNVAVDGQSVYVDDLWDRFHKSANELATVEQTFAKSTSNSGTDGSALVFFGAEVSELSNVTDVELRAEVRHETGANNGTSWSFNETWPWTPFTLDVSAAMAEPGTYTLTISLRVRIETHLATSTTVSIDDLVLISPDYSSGWYDSEPLNAGSPAIWSSVSWTELVDTGTDVVVQLRSGGTSDVQDPSWSEWTNYTNAGGETILAPPNTNLQFRVRLETSISNRTPALLDLRIERQQYVQSGTIQTAPFGPNETLLQWRSFDAAHTALTGATAVTYSLSFEGGPWQEVWPGRDLRAFSGEFVQIRAALSSTNTSQSPRVTTISVTYEVESVGGEPRPPPSSPDPLSLFLGLLLTPWSGLGIASAVAALFAWEVYFRYPHTLEDVFVIARDGRLVVHKTRRLRADRDEDIFAGMLAAIMAFVRDSFKEENKELDHFGFGDRTVYVERGDFGCVAAIYSGVSPPSVRKNLAAFVTDLELSYGEMIRDWSGDRDDVFEIQSMTESFVERRRYAPLWGRLRTPKAS